MVTKATNKKTTNCLVAREPELKDAGNDGAIKIGHEQLSEGVPSGKKSAKKEFPGGIEPGGG